MPPDPLENKELQHLQSFVYLIPILGVLPALWTLYRQTGTREQRSTSRAALVLAFVWSVGYLLAATAQSDTSPLSFLIMSSVLTSGYFVASLALMVRLWQRQPLNFLQSGRSKGKSYRRPR
jgi:protein-S-isoprenylcysteine O-methyltransferase Ste14